MKTLILAGGLGTRLGELTQDTPKPMLEVNGKPVLQTIIERLKKAEFNDIIVNVHYKYEKVIEGIGDKVLYYYTPKLLGHDGTRLALKDWLGTEYFVINGDTLSNIDFKKMYDSHADNTTTVLMEEWRCAGVWLYCGDGQVVPYRPTDLIWQDIGDPQRLEMAKEKFK